MPNSLPLLGVAVLSIGIRAGWLNLKKVDKKASTPYLLKKKKNDKVMAFKVNKQANNGVKRFWVPKEIISNMKSTKKVWIPKGK